MHCQAFVAQYKKPQADAIKQALMGTPSPESADDALSLSGIDVPLSRVESASVVIDRFENSVFHASFTIDWRGVPYTIECPCGKALALAVKTKAYIMADEKVLDSAGIGATA